MREEIMGFSTKPCDEFVAVLATKAPVPGGGGAAALVGALGTALGNMVGSLTVGKKKYADVEAEIMELQVKSDVLQKELLHLIERDAEVFEPLSKAYSLPKETEDKLTGGACIGVGNSDVKNGLGGKMMVYKHSLCR